MRVGQQYGLDVVERRRGYAVLRCWSLCTFVNPSSACISTVTRSLVCGTTPFHESDGERLSARSLELGLTLAAQHDRQPFKVIFLKVPPPIS